MALPNVITVELGSQLTPLIERTLREIGIRSVILDPQKAVQWIKRETPKAVILSGGASSVYEDDAPQPPIEILSLRHPDGQPVRVLGICYGMQWLAQQLGGEVKAVLGNREYGEASIRLCDEPTGFFAGTPRTQKVWMSHGDSVTTLPDGFQTLAYSDAGTIAAMANDHAVGVQFHPEVTHTDHGKKMLENFLLAAGCEKDWQPISIVQSIRNEVGGQVGNEKAIIGFSGGVDSTTLAAIAAPVMGNRLLAVTIDGGHLRDGELDEIRHHAAAAGVTLKVVDASGEFAQVMANITDAEEKRRHFKTVYPEIFVREARRFGATIVIQGTLAPDRIESGATGGDKIKSHHNVGLVMDGLRQLHPFCHLFKYEIRALARELGLPESVWSRQPFPGPGLFLRVVGVPATPEKLKIVRWADAQVRAILENYGLYGQISQLVVAFLGLNTVGVKGDGRVYGGAIGIRPVSTLDFMTSNAFYLPHEVMAEISRAVSTHPEVVRVWWDFTDKPPATTEFE